jgi:hypothetical protein
MGWLVLVIVAAAIALAIAAPVGAVLVDRRVAADARRWRNDILKMRAEKQHRWELEGDPRGTYGDPSDLPLEEL